MAPPQLLRGAFAVPLEIPQIMTSPHMYSGHVLQVWVTSHAHCSSIKGTGKGVDGTVHSHKDLSILQQAFDPSLHVSSSGVFGSHAHTPLFYLTSFKKSVHLLVHLLDWCDIRPFSMSQPHVLNICLILTEQLDLCSVLFLCILGYTSKG